MTRYNEEKILAERKVKIKKVKERIMTQPTKYTSKELEEAKSILTSRGKI